MKNIRTRILKIGSGTLVAQLLSFFLLPIVTHIYTPEEYGKLSLFLAIALVLIPLGTFKFDVILVVLDSEKESKDLLTIGIYTSILISVVSIPAIYTYLRFVENAPNPIAFFQSLLFSFFLLVQCLSVLFTQGLLRLKKDSRIAFSSILQNGSIGILQIGFGRVKPTGEILILSFILGKILGTSPLLRTVKNQAFKQRPRFCELVDTFRKHRAKGILVFSGTLLNAAAIGLPTLVTGFLFGVRYSGIVSVTQSILTVPITFVGGAVGSVLISEISSIKRVFPNDYLKLNEVVRSVRKILLVSTGIFLLVSFTLGPLIFGLLLGDAWQEASKLLMWLIVPFGINFLWLPFSNLLYINGNWDKYLYFSIIQISLSIIFGTVAFEMNLNWLYVSVFMVAGNSIAQICGLIWIFKQIKKNRFNFEAQISD